MMMFHIIRFFVSDVSRGWNWANYYASESVSKYMTGLYSPEQWDKVGSIPDIASEYIATENQITIELIGERFISIVAFDQHGISVGKEDGFYSNEIRIGGK